MKLKSFLFLISYFILNIGFSQEESYFRVGKTTEPCSDSKRTIFCGNNIQKIYLAPGYSLIEFYLLPSKLLGATWRSGHKSLFSRRKQY